MIVLSTLEEVWNCKMRDLSDVISSVSNLSEASGREVFLGLPTVLISGVS